MRMTRERRCTIGVLSRARHVAISAQGPRGSSPAGLRFDDSLGGGFRILKEEAAYSQRPGRICVCCRHFPSFRLYALHAS